MWNTAWLNPTGGLRYHWRAFRFANSHWAPFRREIHEWLAQWRTKERGLIVIGPSAGYCLPAALLERFDEIYAIDPDPFARILFERRFARVFKNKGRLLVWDTSNYFQNSNGSYDVSPLARLLKERKNCAILFCNFLGQLRFLNENDAFESPFEGCKRQIADMLQDKTWASFHDRLSGSVAPRPSRFTKSGKSLSNSELVSELYSGRSNSDGKPAELLDHLTESFLSGTRAAYFQWEIAPGAYHLIEAIEGVALADTRV